jgi:Tol biopolymer transport system component
MKQRWMVDQRDPHPQRGRFLTRRLVRFALALTLVALGSVVFGVPADAHPSGRDGRLTFMREDALGHWQVWVSNADLSASKQLTHENADSGWPVWSPNGQKIAFESTRTDPNPNDATEINDVFTMNADGSSVTQLTVSRLGPSGDPGWSPDGKLIAYESDAGSYPLNQGIYVMWADGSHVRRVTTLPTDGEYWDHAARFSPDGRRLVFTRDGEGSALFTTDLKGHVTQITSFAVGAGDAVWSPRGEEITFEAYSGPTSRGDVYVVHSSGGNLRNLTRNAPGDGASDPVWSPDGRKILFLQGLQQPDSSRVLGLAIMRFDGSNRHFIEDNPIESHQPDWLSRPSTRR